MNENLIRLDGKIYEKSDVVMLPTEKESIFWLSRGGTLTMWGAGSGKNPKLGSNQHIHFTLERETRKDDLPCYVIYNKKIQFVDNPNILASINAECSGKIVATTDESLGTCPKCNNWGQTGEKSGLCSKCGGDGYKPLPRPSSDFLKVYCLANGIIKSILIEVINICDHLERFHKHGDHNGICGGILALKVAADNTITIKPFKAKEDWNKKELIKMFELLVVRGCFRGTESTPGRNYKIALQTFAEQTGIDYEKEDLS